MYISHPEIRPPHFDRRRQKTQGNSVTVPDTANAPAPLSDADRKASLRASMLDGVFTSLMFGFTGNFIIPFAVALKATSAFIGWLSSLPAFLGSLAQLPSAELAEKLGSRLKLSQWCVFVHAATWVLIMLLPFLGQHPATPLLFLALVCANAAAGSLAFPAWSSLMSDTIKKEEYGRYFAWRGSILGMVTLAAGFAAGLVLDIFPESSLRGFAVLYGAAAAMRLVAGYYVGRMKDLPSSPESAGPYSARFTYWQFIRRLPESNFAKFVVFVSLMNFSLSVVGPFFAVYFLQELHLSYLHYTFINLSSLLASLLSLPFWGRYCDRVGTIKIVKVSVLVFPLLPIAWMFTSHLVLMCLLSALGGYVWTGYNLAANNFIYDAASPEKRTRCIAYFSVTNGILVCAGSLLGGYLLPHLPAFPGTIVSSIITLMLISGILRALVIAGLIRSFREVRPAEAMEDSDLLLTILGIRPGWGLLQGLTAVLRPRKGPRQFHGS